MIIADIITRVQRQFGDESGVQVVEADILRWINDAQDEAVLQHGGLLLKSGTISSVAGTQQYTLPADLLDIQSIKYLTSGATSSYNMKAMSRKEMNEYLDTWEGTEHLGDPVFYTRGDKGKIKVFPVPDNSTGTFELFYSRYATDVTTASSPIDLPEFYHNYIMEFCLMKAYEMDEEWDAMDRKAAYVQSTLDANFSREDWISKEVYPSIVPTSGDYV